jgi:hypothetical protein
MHANAVLSGLGADLHESRRYDSLHKAPATSQPSQLRW